MSIILNIDTAIDTAHISIAKDGEVIASSSNQEQKEHGAFLHPAIKSMLDDVSVSLQEIDAVAISAGPGSYTGLRVGMATAKGLCYSLKKPLISVDTLKILAFAAIMHADDKALNSSVLFCPMIDARRMEVFTGLYDQYLQPVLQPCAIILDESSFANYLLNNNIYFLGKGAQKLRLVCDHYNAIFIAEGNNVLAMSRLAYKKLQCNDLADLAYCEPLYLKEFFGGSAKI